MHNSRSVLLAVIIIVVVLSGGCTSSAPSSPVSPALSQPAEKQALSTASPGSFTIKAASLTPGSVLPDVYTCKGASESPEVAWDGIPPGTKSLALILDDPDAPDGRFTHWLVFNIPPRLIGAHPGTTECKSACQRGAAGGNQHWFTGILSPLPPDRDNTPVRVQVVRR